MGHRRSDDGAPEVGRWGAGGRTMGSRRSVDGAPEVGRWGAGGRPMGRRRSADGVPEVVGPPDGDGAMATSSPPNPPRAAMLTPAARWHDACFSAMQPPTVGGERRRGLLCGQVGEHVSRGGEADGVTAERGLVGEVAQDHGLADAVGAEQHGVSSTMR